MKAVVYTGTQKVTVKDIENPTILNARDAVVKVTSAAICGSDLHMYDGRTDVGPGFVFGHEIMGVIQDIGPGVTALKQGDRVVLPFNISCGFCYNCVRGFTSACLTTNDKVAGAAYGYSMMGDYTGGQAEFVRVPYADFNCIKLPGEPHDQYEEDFLMLADIFPTAYHATELANVTSGKTVAIYGAGPVGLLAAHCSILRGASQVFVIDESETRLAVAAEFGAIPINYKDGNPVARIMELRRSNPQITGYMLPGEEKMMGVMCGIDAVGYQAKSFGTSGKEDPVGVLNQLIELVNPTGHIGVVGVYNMLDPGAKDAKAKVGHLSINWGMAWMKGLSFGMGQTPVKKYSIMLRDLIIEGKAKPGKIISHRLPLENAPEAYRLFDFRGVGEGEEYTKVVLKPNGGRTDTVH